MTISSAGLVTVISLVDRPHHDKVVSLAKRAELLPKIIRPLAAMMLTYFLLLYFSDTDKKTILVIAVIIGAFTFLIAVLSNILLASVERHSSSIATVFAVIAMFSGLIISLKEKKELWMVFGVAAVWFAVTWIVAKFGLMLMLLGAVIISEILSAFASPVAVPILAIFAWLNRRTLRKKYKSWVTSRGFPIVEFNREGIKCVNHDNERIFVASPSHRYGGAALAAGIPLFTMTELSNTDLVERRVHEALRTLKDRTTSEFGIPFSKDDHVEITDHPLMEFNPANGLPMINGIGGIDVAGNIFGSDMNQQNFNTGMRHDGFDDH